jgi:hypothetical protein
MALRASKDVCLALLGSAAFAGMRRGLPGCVRESFNQVADFKQLKSWHADCDTALAVAAASRRVPLGRPQMRR